MMPASWMSLLSLSSETSTAAAAAAVSSEDDYKWRSTLRDAADTARLQSGRPSPSSSTPLRHAESMAETASRLLFCMVSWVSRIPSFSALAYSDQVATSQWL